MASINEYLAKILSARYGKDVRQSIHDGIKAINDEVAADKNEVIESKSAAAQYAQMAQDAVGEAAHSASIASSKASEAAVSADAAKNSETNAKDYMEQSKEIYENFEFAGNVTGVKGDSEEKYRTGNVNITKSDIGLNNVNNTSDSDKPISKEQQAALDSKLEKDGEAAETTITFKEATERTNIESGEKTKTVFGKIRKWLADLAPAAFAQSIGSYDDIMANTVAGYNVDALAVKEGFENVNSNLETIKTKLLGSNIYLTANTLYTFTPNIKAESLVFFFCRVNSITQTGITLLSTSGRVYITPTAYFDFTYNITTHTWTFTSNVDVQLISIYTSN